MSRVVVAKCPTYEAESVARALKDCLEAIGGLGAFVREGQTVLLKPNLLAAKPPDAAVTTHPAVVEAVAGEVLSLGAKPVIGDSPPFQGQNPRRYENLCRVTGMRDVADRLGVEIVSLDQPSRRVPVEGGMYRELPIAAAVLDADVVINLPKLKTHGLTAFTGAIKNTFGHIPGLKKSQLHLQAREDREVFSQMLVDVFAAHPPTLSVMDAVIGMEDAGPSNGRPKDVGAIIVSDDAVALDAVACELVNMRPAAVAHVRIAGVRGLGEYELERIEVLGESLDRMRVRGFLPSPTIGSGLAGMPAPLYRIARNQFVPMPRVQAEQCVACGDCAEVCPVKTIQLVPRRDRPGKVAEADLRNCIACYCCDEACNYDAIKIHKGWLGELVRRTRRGL